MKFVIAIFVLMAPTARMWAQSSVQDIVKRSVTVTAQDWNAAPEWGFTERDLDSRHDKSASRTYNVLMIEGSQYNSIYRD